MRTLAVQQLHLLLDDYDIACAAILEILTHIFPGSAPLQQKAAGNHSGAFQCLAIPVVHIYYAFIAVAEISGVGGGACCAFGLGAGQKNSMTAGCVRMMRWISERSGMVSWYYSQLAGMPAAVTGRGGAVPFLTTAGAAHESAAAAQ
ncbi:hypothetical protein [Microbulbifer thermotolerans]|uniref:hypothetical protein n=1 Tax=Microbulbifer thermotolerans TaxID=252514 RepID=UPI0022490FE0|nr:hypothetical protein [Microbulbifer thermotolerans]MCX2830762.1 hypothetical protein [Microbulbifer thermotolerans]